MRHCKKRTRLSLYVLLSSSLREPIHRSERMLAAMLHSDQSIDDGSLANGPKCVEGQRQRFIAGMETGAAVLIALGSLHDFPSSPQ